MKDKIKLIYIAPPLNHCRNCDHAYLRTEKTASWNYEACALGIAPMTTYLTGSCSHHDPMSAEKAKEFIHERPSIIFGEPLEL